MHWIWNYILSFFVAASPAAQFWGHPDTFTPAHRLSGIGTDRASISDTVLEARTKAMIESQTFSILRDPRALAGAQRITSPKMDRIFKDAERKSGVPASLVSAISYLESWGDPKAESPTGPKGIMQVSAATARTMGIRIVYATRYKVSTETRTTKNKRGRAVKRKVRVKTPYTVLVRDDRSNPAVVIPAAAQHLARMQNKFGGMDWAIFAYHCGEGCVARMRSLAEESDIGKPITVARMFFGGSPAHNREVYEAVSREMERDYSPTYWFRVMRAQELLELYRKDPRTFKDLFETYRYDMDPAQRAPHRLAVWLKKSDLEYSNCDVMKREQGKKLQKVFNDPKFFGFDVRKDAFRARNPNDLQYYMSASPSALGALTYIAYETRRLHSAMKVKGEKFVPLEVTSLVRPMDEVGGGIGRNRDEAIWHCTGEVFDINYSRLPNGEREALRFVLDDMGWAGYLGFVDEGSGGDMHIGAAPSQREFFSAVFQDALNAAK